MNAAVADLAALHDTLESAALAAFIASDGDAGCTGEALSEASATAAAAFPSGSAGAAALDVLFAAIAGAAGRQP